MKALSLPRILFTLWLAAPASFVILYYLPESNTLTRSAAVLCAAVTWAGLLMILRRKKAAFRILLLLTLLAGIFLTLPGRKAPDTAALQQEYLTALRRYDGAPYSWGGESPRAIDCSGLVRRGLMDALLLHGLRSADPALLRSAFSQWWHDTSARALGAHHRGLTVPVLSAPSLNLLDHTVILPGDLAVTTNGLHVMAYLGDRQWIAADPGASQVITVTVPVRDNTWFDTPVNIVRWSRFATRR
jgi:NlpC/P60 family